MFKEKRYIVKTMYEHLKILPVSLNNKLLQEKFVKQHILQEHPEIICDKYPLVYSSSINNSDQTKLVTPYFRTTHGCSNHSKLEMEAECLTKNLPYLNLNIFRTKNGRNKL